MRVAFSAVTEKNPTQKTNKPNQTNKQTNQKIKNEKVAEPLYFVDFLREPVVDDATGEVLVARPSHYEAVPGGLAEVRERAEALQVVEGRVVCAVCGVCGGGGGAAVLCVACCAAL